jgi:3-hydroxyisobutyrate dehydrogenase-like beta-hydroxyacid dehydrogenase
MTAIAFIGLGHMGLPMAKNLLDAGHRVRGYDINPEALEAFSLEGGQPCDDIPSTVKDAEVVITMLPEGKHVREAYEGPLGIFKHITPETLIAECSTIDIETARHIHNEADKKGFKLIDAPVSGVFPVQKPQPSPL